MVRRIAFAALCALLVSGPARASDGAGEGEKMLDLGSRVVFGIPMTIAGAVLMIPAGLATLATRPSELDTTFDYLVMGPVRYTWVDPLGEHPQHEDRTALRNRERYASGAAEYHAPGSTPSGD
jgi:hypothetical protein